MTEPPLAAPEQLLDAYSKVNDSDGVPHFGTCTYVIGDGTSKVEFVNGRAKVPLSLAPVVARHPQIDIPALAAYPAATLEIAAAEPAAPEPTAPASTSADDAVTTVPGWTDASEAVKAAQEYLAAEGEDVPAPQTRPDVEFADSETAPSTQPPAAPRDGFDTHTQDGQVRCQAAKTDGGQCANPAAESSQACALAKHQEQLQA